MEIKPNITTAQIKIVTVAIIIFLIMFFIGGGIREPIYETFLAASIVAIIVFVVGLFSLLPDRYTNRVKLADGKLVVKTLFSTKELNTEEIFSVSITKYGERNPFYSILLSSSSFRRQFKRLTVRTSKEKVHIPYKLYESEDVKDLIRELKKHNPSIQLYIKQDPTINPFRA